MNTSNMNIQDTGALPQLETRGNKMNPAEARGAVIDLAADDVQFVLRIFTACIAEVAAKGGDTRYAAQNCFAIARQALGVVVAMRLMESHTRLLDTGEALWLNPAIPPEGQRPPRVGL